jgi:hypothetical protein
MTASLLSGPIGWDEARTRNLMDNHVGPFFVKNSYGKVRIITIRAFGNVVLRNRKSGSRQVRYSLQFPRGPGLDMPCAMLNTFY